MNVRPQRYVPDEIVSEILYRLPIKSLFRFTSVSKSWKARVESSSFMFAREQINKSISCSHLVYTSLRDAKYCTLIPEEASDVVRSLTQVSLPLTGRVEILGSCEGLVWLRARRIIYIWNPIIRTLKQIAPFEPQETGNYWMVKQLAFGFAPQSGDYRIVNLLWEGDYLTGAEMYSLSTDLWTTFKPLSGRLEREPVWLKCSNVCFKGSIYWLASMMSRMREPMLVMLRFDLDKERIEEIEIDTGSRDAHVQSRITVINGFLVLFDFWTVGEDATIFNGYIYKESKSGSLFRTAFLDLHLPIRRAHSKFHVTNSGHIIVRERRPYPRDFALHLPRRAHSTFHVTNSGHIIGREWRPYPRDFAYVFNCDGEKLSFERVDLGFICYSSKFDLTPIKETIHLLDKSDVSLIRY